MGFDIKIVASENKETSSVSVTGSEQHIITDDERATFGLSDQQQAVSKYFGKQPNDAYLHSPTPWDDLYKRYGWPQVETVAVSTRAEVLEVTSQPVILQTKTFTNSSSVSATFNVGISESVNDTTTSSWNTGGKFTFTQTMKYQVGFLGTGGGGETSLQYEESWGEGETKSKSITLGQQSGVAVTLDPGQTVEVELTSSRGVMKVRVYYKAYLTGVTAVNYNPTYKGHHFWALDIGAVMSAGGISNSIQSTEDIDIGYFGSGNIIVKDKKTGVRLGSTIF